MGLALYSNNLFFQQKLENRINLIRKIVTCLIVVVLAVIVFGQGFTQSNALITKSGSGSNAVYTAVNKEGETETIEVKKLTSSVFGGVVLDMAYSAYGGGLTSFNKNLLKIETDPTNAPYWATLDAAYGAISSIGCGLALLWCLLELIDKASQGHITGEFFLQLGIKFTIAAVVISSGDIIAKGVIELANEITDILAEEAFTSTNKSSALDQMFIDTYNDIKKAHVIGCMGAMIPLLVSSLMTKICTIIIFALLVGRILEVGVRYMFFPIGASDIFTHGMASPGFRYVKKLFAAALQGIAMYAIVFIGQVLMVSAGTVIGNSTETLAGGLLVEAVWPIIVLFSTIGAMLKVSSIVNDIAG